MKRDVLAGQYRKNVRASVLEGMEYNASVPNRLSACIGDVFLHTGLFSNSDDPKVKELENRLCLYLGQWTTHESGDGIPCAKSAGGLNRMVLFVVRALSQFKTDHADDGVQVSSPSVYQDKLS
jgi:hypothetical protein